MTRRAVVTGAAGGVGREVAKLLAARGLDVAVCGRTRESAEAAAEGLPGARAYAADLRDASAISAMVERVKADGNVDVLVHAAGIPSYQPFLESTPEKWDELWAVDLRAVLQISHALVPGMVDNGWGRVVIVTSDAGRAGSRNESAYGAVKGGAMGFMRSFAKEVARAGVTVNAVSPSPIETVLLDEWRQHHPDQVEKLRKRIPAGRFATVEDVAHTIDFLCTDEAGYVSGQTISVNGALHAY